MRNATQLSPHTVFVLPVAALARRELLSFALYYNQQVLVLLRMLMGKRTAYFKRSPMPQHTYIYAYQELQQSVNSSFLHAHTHTATGRSVHEGERHLALVYEQRLLSDPVQGGGVSHACWLGLFKRKPNSATSCPLPLGARKAGPNHRSY